MYTAATETAVCTLTIGEARNMFMNHGSKSMDKLNWIVTN